MGRFLRHSRPSGIWEVYLMKPKLIWVSASPLKIIHQWPSKVAFYFHAVFFDGWKKRDAFFIYLYNYFHEISCSLKRLINNGQPLLSWVTNKSTRVFSRMADQVIRCTGKTILWDSSFAILWMAKSLNLNSAYYQIFRNDSLYDWNSKNCSSVMFQSVNLNILNQGC